MQKVENKVTKVILLKFDCGFESSSGHKLQNAAQNRAKEQSRKFPNILLTSCCLTDSLFRGAQKGPC